MTLHDFQKGLLEKADFTKNKKAKHCYRDCVNCSGAIAYSTKEIKLSDIEIIKKVANYQLTRFDVPKEVIDYFRTLPHDIPLKS